MSINEDDHLTLSCSIRFIVDSIEETKLFTTQFPQYMVDTGIYFKDKTKYVIAVNLQQGMDLQSLKDFIHDQKGSGHDFFISVTTNRDSEIVELPDYVVDCIRVLGGKICFSFTCVID